jgi:hypothetical protein
MAKKFNDTGNCIPAKHYMVDTSNKLIEITKMIEEGLYFTLNRPRQFGKTTTLFFLRNILRKNPDYLVFDISFEGIGDAIFEQESTFCPGFLRLLANSIKNSSDEISKFLLEKYKSIISLEDLSLFITLFVQKTNKKIVVQIDEVDKSSNNQLFVHFLGMLRNKYLDSSKGDDYTFHSVVLAGVHDVKTLKLKISSDSTGKLNSPWNIAADFTVDMSFNPDEIATMLVDYSQDKQIEMDIPAISEQIYYYTSGYPYLVSKICKVVDEIILPKSQSNKWTLDDIEQAFAYLTDKTYTTTLFDDLIKNLENNPKLYDFIYDVLMGDKQITFDIDNTNMNLAYIYGIIDKQNKIVKIHNRIFDQRLSAYMVSKLNTDKVYYIPNTYPNYYIADNLDLKAVFRRFQVFMHENYSHRDQKFLEREGRLLFLAFLKPVLNGKGYEFKEPVVGDERRMDIVVVYQNMRYVIELKRWYGEEAHQKGLQQLSDYLDIYSLKQGFLLIYDFRKEKQSSEECIQFKDKEIFAVWV